MSASNKLGRGPKRLVRAPVTRKVSIGKLNFGEGRVYDAHFTKLYQSWLTGRLKSGWTRIDLDRILPGVIRHARGKEIEQIEFEEDIENAQHFVGLIRRGLRPALMLYPGHLAELKDWFICADDMSAFYAYKELGIGRVPAILLGKCPPRTTPESIFETAYEETGSVRDLKLRNRAVTHVAMFLDPSPKRLLFIRGIQQLKAHAEAALDAIKKFHRPVEPKIVHYHETMHSIVYRVCEALAAIEMLEGKKLLLQARPIIRSLYELFLDWLAPEQVGPLLQNLASVRGVNDSAQQKALEELLRDRTGGLVDLCENVAAKSKFSPLGELGYERIYRRLSQSAHQDFGITVQYSSSLTRKTPIKRSREEAIFLLRTIDMVVSALITRVLDDFGSKRLRDWPSAKGNASIDASPPGNIKRVTISRPA